MPALAILHPVPAAPAKPPEALPMGRAALRLGARGVRVLIGDRSEAGQLHGYLARPGEWVPTTAPVFAAYDRFPSHSQALAYQALRAGLRGVPIANPPQWTALLRDKVLTQRFLEGHGLPLPEIEEDPSQFSAAISRWGGAFIKPRCGSFGEGIRLVEPGEDLSGDPSFTAPEPAFLQAPVLPPPGYAGVSVRALLTRRPGGPWDLRCPVARASAEDVVVNAARGAACLPLAEAWPTTTCAAVRDASLAVAALLSAGPDAHDLIEIGVDLALDPHGDPWILEVNSRPRGRLSALAQRDPAQYAQAAEDAVFAPLLGLVETYA